MRRRTGSRDYCCVCRMAEEDRKRMAGMCCFLFGQLSV